MTKKPSKKASKKASKPRAGKPNINTQAIAGYDYEVFLEDGPLSLTSISKFTAKGFELVSFCPAPGSQNQTQVVFRRKRAVHSYATD